MTKKLDKDMINGVSGGEVCQRLDGQWEIINNNGENIFSDGRAFATQAAAKKIAIALGENATVLTPEERAGLQFSSFMDKTVTPYKQARSLK